MNCILFLISCKDFLYKHHPTDKTAHTTTFVTSVVEHWYELELITIYFFEVMLFLKCIICSFVNFFLQIQIFRVGVRKLRHLVFMQNTTNSLSCHSGFITRARVCVFTCVFVFVCVCVFLCLMKAVVVCFCLFVDPWLFP